MNWLNRLDADHDNFRTALTWAMETAPEKGLHLAERLSEFWRLRGYWLEAREWYTRILALPANSSPTALRAQALGEAANRTFSRGDRTQVKAMLEESLAIWRKLGEKQGLAKALDDLGFFVSSLNDHARSEQLHRESLILWREQGDKPGTARALLGLGTVEAAQGDWTKATGLFQESLVTYRELGDKEKSSFVFQNQKPADKLGFLAESQGDFGDAQRFFEEGLSQERELGITHHIAWALRYLGDLLYRQGDFVRVQVLYEESLMLVQSMKDKYCAAHALAGLARVAQQMGDKPRAVELAEKALALYEQLGSKLRIPKAQQIIAGAITGRDSERAIVLFKSSLTLGLKLGLKGEIAETLQEFGSACLFHGMAERAVRFFAMADAVRAVISFPMTPWELAAREKELSTARAQLDEAAFDAAWEKGNKMTLEQAVGYALKDSDA